MLNISKIFIKIVIIFILVISAVTFILIYNTHLIDAATANLHIAFSKANKLKIIEEYREIAPFINNAFLDELSSGRLNLPILAKLEFIQEVVNNPHDISQVEDVKIFLEDIIQERYKNRWEIFYFIDEIIIGLSPAKVREIPPARLNSLVVDLSKKTISLKRPLQLQKAFFSLGNIFIKLNDFKKAEEAFRKAIDIGTESNLTTRAKFNLAWINRLQEEYDISISIFTGLANQYPDTELASYCNYEIGNLMRKSIRFFEALNIYNSLSSQEPGSFFSQLAQFQAGYLYLYNPVLKDYREADRIFRRLTAGIQASEFVSHVEKKVVPRLATYYRNLGFLLIFQKEYKEALEQFSKALDIFPDYGSCYSGEALAFLNLDDKAKALTRAREASRITPNDPIVSVNLGFVYINLGMVDEAIEEYKRFISVYPKSKEAHYNLGYAYAIKGNAKEAVAEFRQATKIDSEFAKAYNNIGYILWQKGSYAEAIIEFKKAVQLQFRYPSAHFNLALALMIQGRYLEARQEFEIVLALAPDDLVAANNLEELNRIIAKEQ